ncbi:unnamed protein product [Schistosoma turkestanicum]|nr:unnamed protein product [Schistosoma turkestanicum]
MHIGSSFPASTLEPIHQGQELQVGSMTTCTDESKFTVQNCPSSSSNHHTTITQLKIEICCPCRLNNANVIQQNDCSQDTELTCNEKTALIPNTTETTTTKHTNSPNHPFHIHGQGGGGDNHTNNRDSVTSRSSWARSIFERLRASSLTSSFTTTNESKTNHFTNNNSIGHNDHIFRFKEHNVHHYNHNVNISSDVIDPRRLPKIHGPVSHCLEFAKKPLQKSNHHFYSKSIPVSSTHTDLLSSSLLSNSLQSSNMNNHNNNHNNHNNKHRKRIRWFSHSTSCDMGPGDPILVTGHIDSISWLLLYCNVYLGMIFGAQQLYALKIKHLLSMRVYYHIFYKSKEELSPSSFGHFDENHVYTTLFRHSTCYDVLPGSGKLVILDSRLPTLRAICALLDNGVMAAPVWCDQTQSYMGVFSQELALDMLGYLHYTEVIKTGHFESISQTLPSSSLSTSSSPSATDTPDTMNSSASSTLFFTTFNANLYGWGTKQLGEVFNLMYNRQLCSDLFVYPHYCLQKALYRLFHHHNHHNHPHHPRPYHQNHYHPLNSDNFSHHDALFKFKYFNLANHRASYPNNSIKMPIYHHHHNSNNSNNKFTQQTSTVHPSPSNHSSSRVSFTETNPATADDDDDDDGDGDDSMDPRPSSPPPHDSQSSNNQTANSNNKSDNSMSGIVISDIERVSCKCCPLSNPTSLYASLVSYLIVIDDHSGNALGLLCADRLLAYLRLRVDELPNTGRMNIPIGSVQGLRWTERYLSKKPNDTKISATNNLPSKHMIPECLRLQFKEIPILQPNDLVRDALHILTNWLPQLPCLPVIHFLDDNPPQTIDHISFISPGDLLNFIIYSPSNTALNEPISKIIENKAVHCPYQQQCICFVTETVAVVLDRMFRLKAPCLLMFDTPKNCASNTAASKPFGKPIGLVTAKDILHTVILGHRHRLPSLHPHIDESETINQNTTSDDQISYRNKIRDNYKRTVSFESGVLSSSHDDSESTHDDVIMENSEEKFSRSPSICSLSSSGTFSVPGSNEELIHSLSNEHFTSTCTTDTVTQRDHCNCSCHHQTSTSFDIRQQQHQHYSNKIQNSMNVSVGSLDKNHNRTLPSPGGEWCADRRSSVPYTRHDKKKGIMHILENKIKSTIVVDSNRIPQLTTPNPYIQHSNDSNNSLQVIDNSLDKINELTIDVSDNRKNKQKLEQVAVTREDDDTVFPMD